MKRRCAGWSFPYIDKTESFPYIYTMNLPHCQRWADGRLFDDFHGKSTTYHGRRNRDQDSQEGAEERGPGGQETGRASKTTRRKQTSAGRQQDSDTARQGRLSPSSRPSAGAAPRTVSIWSVRRPPTPSRVCSRSWTTVNGRSRCSKAVPTRRPGKARP